MLSIDKASAERLLPFPELIGALRAAFRDDITVPLRQTLKLPDERSPIGTSLLMPAWNRTGYYGVKLVNIFPENAKRGLPGLHSVYMLFDGNTGVPLASLDGDVITSRRTAAAAALGVDRLARSDASRLLVVGAGRVASLVAPAVATVRALREVEVWNPTREAAQRCAQQWRELGLPARAVTDLEAGVRRADIVSCATLATAPLIEADWLKEGSHLDLIGSFTPEMTEASPACFADAGVWVDTEEAIGKSGDILNAISAGAMVTSDIKGTMFDLCRGRCEGRTSSSQRTVFKAVGSALEDLAAAILVFEGCRDRLRG
ncbi:Delta(1)-pyrroline-2-carboxylate reductase [Pandoraea cepalis]|uniref:Delta(1)-pyrroline-2-carboxylate reductase n=1 Tax=Pandoraea cepalis TaxID=2508294 RepID=A0A5E4S898_9BURK|nr:ornithine cyclodeaminase family protein [Pandoraea cepalis]VVD71293.1 Delta(1)-pyrroline-2-carboxylate reductase [Pandoraea cepalis]